MNEINEIVKPNLLTNNRGLSEKLVIPSIAKSSILPNEYPDLPCFLCSLLNTTCVCLKPNQAICPLRNLFCYGISFK